MSKPHEKAVKLMIEALEQGFSETPAVEQNKEVAMSKPRMRTRDKTIEMLRHDDPETSITRNALDCLIRAGKVPTVKIGNKVLLNYDTLLDVLANGTADAPQKDPQPGGIRRIEI